jgi:hypothetical protein
MLSLSVRFEPQAYISQCNRDVRFGSKADMCGATSHVCFNPELPPFLQSGDSVTELECPKQIRDASHH